MMELGVKYCDELIEGTGKAYSNYAVQATKNASSNKVVLGNTCKIT